MFAGTNQYHRFLMSLHRTMSVPAQGEGEESETSRSSTDLLCCRRRVCIEMERLGIKTDEIGTHSVRKVNKLPCQVSGHQ